MRSTKDKLASRPDPATVILNNKHHLKQPGTFRLCPLGVQFYSVKKMPEFELVEFKMDVPAKNGKKPVRVDVSGIVVNCRPEKDSKQYRIWIKFVDLKESIREHIQGLAKSCKTLCPYCENY